MALSPMMQQYMETKEQYKDCLLFYRLGDFYEMFFDDALTGSRELEITLTGKDCGLPERAPMCGIPYHAADSYINKLVAKGYKVAIAEQVEDPKLAKGLVKREVIKVVTPGTNTNDMALDADNNNYLMFVHFMSGSYALSFTDITTGDFRAASVSTAREVIDEINKFHVAELVANSAFEMSQVDTQMLRDRYGITCFTVPDSYFDFDRSVEIIKKHFHVIDLSGLGLNDRKDLIPCIGATLSYLYETQKTSLDFLNRLTLYTTDRYMIIDSIARRNLELTETMRENAKKGSLFWVMDKTKTAMGARRIRAFIEQPLKDKNEIVKRQDAIEELNRSVIDRDELREYLGPVYDIERLMAKISYRSAGPRDLIAFKNSAFMLPHIKRIIGNYSCELLKEIYDSMDCLEDIYELINSAINDEPPVNIKEGGIIKDGYLEQIDTLRRSKTEGRTWLAELEEREKEATGIKNLKVRYNKVFGYYIEVTNSFKDLVPDRYIRKQTLVNAERFITDELKELEDIILGAEEKLFSLEYDTFSEIRDRIASRLERIQKTAAAVSYADAFASLAYIAEKNNYVRPLINTDGVIDIRDGRHPVVELSMDEGRFIPNDTYADKTDHRVSIITGPNMAGKSTYMRQLALIVLMAGCGSFVPASYANIPVCDRILTRVGASDDLASGQSTFMVEMTEVANILRSATSDSLIILDEIGRGTSTFDGLSIAWAVVEFIADINKCGAKTFFSTHYHELTELEGRIEGVKNYCISVKEQGDNIIFLRKITRGGASKSYGIQVASLAGVPDEITSRAQEILNELIRKDAAQGNGSALVSQPGRSENGGSYSLDGISDGTDINKAEVMSAQLDVDIEPDRLRMKLEEVNVDRITPLEALNLLYELKDML